MLSILADKVLNTIRRECLFNEGDIVFVALSGGADSVALLRVLLLLKETLRLSDVKALHVHHGLRDTADRDEQFVQALCKELSVPLFTARVNVRNEITQTGESIEEAARRLRYTFFEETIAPCDNAKIATAHHLDDQAETVLFRLIRGTSLNGIGGIPYKRSNIVRPFLDCSAEEIRLVCKQSQWQYMIDETNYDVTYARNRLRYEVMPVLSQINEKAPQNIVRFSAIAREENLFLENEAAKLLDLAMIHHHSYRSDTLKNAPAILCRRALRIAVQRFGAAVNDTRHLDALCKIIHNGGCTNLSGDIGAICEDGVLSFKKFTRRATVAMSSETIPFRLNQPFVFRSQTFIAEIIDRKEFCEILKINKILFNFCVSYDKISNDIFLRSRKEGDTMRPSGRHCTKSLKKLFNEMHIPPEKRDDYPVVCCKDAVLGVLGVAIDEQAAVTENTVHIVYFKKISNESM